MKRITKTVIVAAVALMAAASTEAATYTGDLLLGFTSQSGNDFVVDIGQASALTSGQTFNLSGSLGGFNLNSVNWGIIGDKNVAGIRNVWTTTGGTSPNTVGNTAQWGQIDTATKSIYSGFITGGAGDTITPASTDDNGWNQQTKVGGLATQYHNVYEDPNVVGLGSASVFNLIANGSAPTSFGTFTLDSGGVVTFTAAAVPEPSTYGLLAGAGLLVICLRRQFLRRA